MKLHISGSGEDPDDRIVRFTIVAETDTHKTTLEFYGYHDVFKAFADKLELFPFHEKGPVQFEDGDWKKTAYGLLLKIELTDKAGHIKFTVQTRHAQHNEAALFSDTTVEAMPLTELSRKLQNADFRHPSELTWQS